MFIHEGGPIFPSRTDFTAFVNFFFPPILRRFYFVVPNICNGFLENFTA